MQRTHLYARTNSCFWCWKKLAFEESTIDHLKPRSLGGTDDWKNIVLSCFPCNQKRGTALPTKDDKKRRRRVYGD